LSDGVSSLFTFSKAMTTATETTVYASVIAGRSLRPVSTDRWSIRVNVLAHTSEQPAVSWTPFLVPWQGGQTAMAVPPPTDG
jgi:hypothetical protein